MKREVELSEQGWSCVNREVGLSEQVEMCEQGGGAV